MLTTISIHQSLTTTQQEMIGLRRFKPTISHTHPYLLTANKVLPDYYDEDVFPTLPMIVNPQAIRYRRPEALPSQYFPSTSFRGVIENEPFACQCVHTPTLIEERPSILYRSYETPIRVVEVPSRKKNVHLPKHTKKLVSRFLNNLEQAHDHQHIDGNESDSTTDDCYVCRQLRSAMNDGKRRSMNDEDLYRSSRVVFETQNSSKHAHTKNCNVCNLLQKSDFGISDRSKQGKHVHVIETFPSNNQAPLYPTGYTTFVDPNTGLAYAYDPSWQYNTNPVYIPSHSQSYPPTMDKSTYTRIPSDDRKHESNDKTIFIHTPRNPTPKIIIEQPRRRHRRSRRNRSTTIVTERITRLPRTKTTSYI